MLGTVVCACPRSGSQWREWDNVTRNFRQLRFYPRIDVQERGFDTGVTNFEDDSLIAAVRDIRTFDITGSIVYQPVQRVAL